MQSGRRAGWRLGRKATTVLEFALIAPAFLLFFMAILGVGIDSFYQLNLDDALRNASRQVQIGAAASQNGVAFAQAVCNEFAVANGCTSNLTFNVQSNVPPSNFASLTPVPMPPSGALADQFQPGAANSNVLLQVAYPLPFTMPLIGSAITFTGTNSIMAITTVRVEPHA